MTISTTVTCTCGSIVEAEGKAIHFCAQRDGCKVVSREHVGFYDGRPICYRAFSPTSAIEVAAELDRYIYDLLTHTAIETADQAADVAALESTEAPLLIEPVQECDAYGCHQPVTHTVNTGRDHFSTYHVCCYHLETDITGVPCGCVFDTCDPLIAPEPPAEPTPEETDDSPGGPYAQCPGAIPGVPCGGRANVYGFCGRCESALGRTYHASGVAWERRARQILDQAIAAHRFDPPTEPDSDPTPPWTCTACDGAHHVQRCPELRALLFAPVVRRVIEQAA